MKLEDCNLRNKEFREFLISRQHLWHTCFKKAFSILEKDNINESDIMKFCIEISKHSKQYFDYSLSQVIFEYKMKKISKDRLVKFIKMIKEEYPSLAIDESITYEQLIYKCSGAKFYDIINTFLDVV